MSFYPYSPNIKTSAPKTSPLQQLGVTLIAGTPCLAFVAVVLRFYTRRTRHTRLAADDWIIIVAMALSLGLIAPSIDYLKMWHFGLHILDVPSAQLEPNFEDNYRTILSFNLMNIPILPLAKASIILLLLRVGSVIKFIRIGLYTIFAFNFLACFIPWVFFLFMCPPRTGNTWLPTTFGGLKCAGRVVTGRVSIFVTCANLLTDLLIFPVPFLIMRRAKTTSLRTRVGVVFLFASSLAVTAISSAKIYLVYRDRLYSESKTDWTYTIDFALNHVENNVAIIVACFPVLRGMLPRKGDSQREISMTYGYGSQSSHSSQSSQSLPSPIDSKPPFPVSNSGVSQFYTDTKPLPFPPAKWKPLPIPFETSQRDLLLHTTTSAERSPMSVTYPDPIYEKQVSQDNWVGKV